MVKYKDRKEQRMVTETMGALLLPMVDFLNNNTAILVRRALFILGETDIESQEESEE